MPDIFDKEKRSNVMKAVKHRDTLPELIIQSLIRDLGVTYEREYRIFNSKPDIVVIDLKKAFFVNGCFWHGHNCRKGKLPETNKLFWGKKISKTIMRDMKNYGELKENGWDYIVIWECEIKKKALDILIKKITDFLSVSIVSGYDKSKIIEGGEN